MINATIFLKAGSSFTVKNISEIKKFNFEQEITVEKDFNSFILEEAEYTFVGPFSTVAVSAGLIGAIVFDQYEDK